MFLLGVTAASFIAFRQEHLARETLVSEHATELKKYVERDTAAKGVLRKALSEGSYLRTQIFNAIRATSPIGPWVPQIDSWILTTQVDLERQAPEYVAFFLTDTGDKPVAPAYTTEAFLAYQGKINDAHLGRFDRHLVRLREIIYERL